MRLNKISLAALALGGSMLLSACGGGGNDSPLRPLTRATADVTVDINSETVKVLLNNIFSFDAGIADLGTTSLTTLKFFGSDTSKSSFEIESGGYKATGEMTYGSCIFTIATSNYPLSFSALQVGVATEATPCQITALTRGFDANGVAFETTMRELIGQVYSSPRPVTISISPAGVVTWFGLKLGTISVLSTTGAGN